MKKLILVAFCGITLWTACSEQPAVTVATRTAGPNDSLFRINEGPYKFSLFLPKDIMINHRPEVKMSDATGELHVRMGEHFHLVFHPKDQDLKQVVSDLATDDLFTNKVIEDNGVSLVYQQVLPTGETFGYHYCVNVQPAGAGYFVQTSPMGEFSIESISRMKQVVASISAL